MANGGFTVFCFLKIEVRSKNDEDYTIEAFID
jgi:hypothetical protein